MQRTFRAPGRVNLIGEHTDYNDGFVMPAAIPFATRVTVEAREDGQLRVRSVNLKAEQTFALDREDWARRGDWTDYPVGVALALRKHGIPVQGADLRIEGDIPLGAGLSSSASIEVATALALCSLSGAVLEGRTLARLCQQAENEFVGARCGIMDQFATVHGEAGKALLLDCRTLEYRALTIPAEMRIVVCNTMVRHSIAASGYNLRREECEAGVQLLRERNPALRALRDATLTDLEAARESMPDAIFRRCRHVITENARVLLAARALKAGDLVEFGTQMYASHASLRKDFEVSCDELDWLVASATSLSGVIGARMTGGGFGGCTVNLVEAPRVEEFCGAITEAYRAKSGIGCETYVCTASDGAGEEAQAP